MKAHLSVGSDFLVPRVWSPVLIEEAYRHGVAEQVQLQPTCCRRVHDRGVVHHFHLHTKLLGAQDEVGMCGGTAWVTSKGL